MAELCLHSELQQKWKKGDGIHLDKNYIKAKERVWRMLSYSGLYKAYSVMACMSFFISNPYVY